MIPDALSGVPHRYFAGIPSINSTKGADEEDALKGVLDRYTWSYAQMLYIMSDSAASCITMAQLANDRRRELLCGMLVDGSAIVCDFLPTDIQKYFVIDTAFPRILIPMDLIKLPDMIHIFKNAEIHAMRELDGGRQMFFGINRDTKEPRKVKILMKSVLLCFARMSAENTSFQLLIEHFEGCGIPTIPGVIKHRLKIIPFLAHIVHNYRDSIFKAIEVVNEAFGDGRWKADSQGCGFVAHVKDILIGLSIPSVRLQVALFAELRDVSEKA